MTSQKQKIGFVPDFSYYLERHYPILKAFNHDSFIEKIGNILKEILSEENPTFELQQKGYCKKAERMDHKRDKEFFQKLAVLGIKSSTMYPYYLSFGKNKYGIALWLNSSNRHAYFLALDVDHSIRRYHGKFG